MRAFIFSIDAFVAFTLAILAVYSLVFFSSVPSGYYGALAQAHALALDGLGSLSRVHCVGPAECRDNPTLLEYIVLRNTDPRFVSDKLGSHIPAGFGYRLDRRSSGNSWDSEAPVYDSAVSGLPDDAGRPKEGRKLNVSAYAVVFETTQPKPSLVNPYYYNTCKGQTFVCGEPLPQEPFYDAKVYTVRLIVYT